MKLIKYISIIVIGLQLQMGFAQSYDFVPSEFIQLSDEEVAQMNIMIQPGIMLFNDKGDKLGMNQLSLMTNPEFRPIFYADTNGKIKAIVFENKLEHPILVQHNKEANFTEGEYAMDFLVNDMTGKSFKLSELRGKVVVLNFWFTKCPPCIQEMPSLNTLVSEFKGKDVVFLAITFNKKDVVKQFLEEKDFNYTIAANANDVITMYGVQSYPTSIVINKKGEIVLKELGFRTNIKDVLSKSIKSLL